MTAMNNQHDFDSVWVDPNTQIINAENRAARRKRATTALGWVVAMTAGAVLATLIFWGAVTSAQDAATIAHRIMAF